jgi:hypothetical protein
MWGLVPTGTVVAAEKIKCPGCFKEVLLEGDLYKDKTKAELPCGCVWRRETLERLLGKRI